MAKPTSKAPSSSGHKLGQIIGDWWELDVLYPTLLKTAESLGLFLDNRCVERIFRNKKIHWADSQGNNVDYDFVLELGGTVDRQGVPLGFIECFWRRGARHSKDKARDDTNKLLPMRNTYPTARFLSIAACGEFTEPAREYVRSRDVELFFVSKVHIIAAFNNLGIAIDYPDDLSEEHKRDLVNKIEAQLDGETKKAAADEIRKVAGNSAFSAYHSSITAALTATPQEIRISRVSRSEPVVFTNVEDAQLFIKSTEMKFIESSEMISFEYDITFSDGTEFGQTCSGAPELLALNSQISELVKHFS